MIYDDKQALEFSKKLQAQYEELFEQFKAGEYKGSTPKNEIKVSLNGLGKMKSIEIDHNFDTNNRPLLEAMLFIAFDSACDAFNEAHTKYKKNCDQAYCDAFKDLTSVATKQFPSTLDVPKIKWNGTKKIDGEEN